MVLRKYSSSCNCAEKCKTSIDFSLIQMIFKQACYTGIRVVGSEAKYVFGCANKRVSTHWTSLSNIHRGNAWKLEKCFLNIQVKPWKKKSNQPRIVYKKDPVTLQFFLELLLTYYKKSITFTCIHWNTSTYQELTMKIFFLTYVERNHNVYLFYVKLMKSLFLWTLMPGSKTKVLINPYVSLKLNLMNEKISYMIVYNIF